MKKIILTVCLLLWAFSLPAAIITVDINGQGDYTTIQDGIDAAADGDTILVYTGIYNETINFYGKEILVASEYYIDNDENLIVDYNNTIEKICEFIEEECTEEIYSWIENTNVKKNEAWSGKVKKLHSSSIEKWKKEENKERVQEVMENKEVVRLLEELDYL